MTKFEILVENCRQSLIAIDQWVNTLGGILHSILDICRLSKTPSEIYYADETMSAHSYRDFKNGVKLWPKKLIDTLFFFEQNHCRGSYTSEVERRHLPPEYRNK